MPGARGPRPYGLGPLFVVYAATVVGFVGAVLVVDWADEDPVPPAAEVDFATTEELEQALRHALAQLPREGSPRETAGDRRAREVIEQGLAGEVVIVPTEGSSAPPPTVVVVTPTTRPSPTTTSTTTTTTAPPERPSVGEMADELVDDLVGGSDGPP